MSEAGGSLEASMVFEKLFTDYMKCQADNASRKLIIRKLERARQEQPILGGISINEDGTVSVNIREESEYEVVLALSKAFDSIMDVLAFSMGQEPAFRQAEAVVSAVMRQFREPFDRLGVRNHLLKGAMADRTLSGVNGLDAALGGGFPKSEMVLVCGPPGMAKYNMGTQFLSHGLAAGGAGLAVISGMNVKEFREMLSKRGASVSSCESKGKLRIVDWYSHKSRPVTGLEEHGPVLVPSKDIANLEIALARAMEGLSFAPSNRAFVDVITFALSIYELSDVMEFLSRQKSKFRERGITCMFLVELGVHDERIMATLKHASDSVLSLTVGSKGDMSIEVEAMSAPNFRRGKLAVQVSYRGISVMETALDEVSVISDFCNIPSVTRDIAQKLVDAGFTDLNQLSRADEADLLKIAFVTREVARNIAEYTRTVEYTQSVLSTRSDKWLKKAKEQAASGDLRRARKSLERALEIDPSNALALAEMADIDRVLEKDS